MKTLTFKYEGVKITARERDDENDTSGVWFDGENNAVCLYLKGGFEIYCAKRRQVGYDPAQPLDLAEAFVRGVGATDIEYEPEKLEADFEY